MPRYKEETDWQDVIRTPEKLFGYSYIYLLVILFVLGLLYIWNLNVIGNNIVPSIVKSDTASSFQDIPFRTPRSIPPVDVMKIGISSVEMVDQGRGLYKTNCVSCHGDDGRGDGLSAGMLNPRPRNLRSLSGWKNGSKVTEMYTTLQEGIPGSAMGSFSYLPPEDRFALIHYIRTFASNQPNDTPEDFKNLDAAYTLSQGTNEPGQIPIKKAIRLTLKETSPIVLKIHRAGMNVSVSNTKGEALFKHCALDKEKALTIALNMQSTIKNANDFMKRVSANPIQAGFKVEVIRLSADEWSELHRYIYQILREEG